jgi:membrane associated rhomboid family serine protease
MLFPIGDDNNNRRTVPFINYALILINVLIFLYQQANPAFTYGFSVVPAEITGGVDIDGMVRIGRESLRLYSGPTPIYLTLITAMFMHGDWGHLLGNMLYLWIFGDNIEDRVGHGRYLLFYLGCGLLASLTHIYFGPQSVVPSLGASGAIAGVLGAYLVVYPHQSVRVFQFGRIVEMPALIVIGFWGLLQFLNGFGSLASVGKSGGVAYMAHIGGFVAGIVIGFVIRGSRIRF